MSDKESRAMGTGRKIVVAGKEYMLRPVVVQQLCDLEQEALQFFCRQVLKTYTANADLLGDRADALIAQKFEEVSRLTLDEVPMKSAYDVSSLPITNKMLKWVTKFGKEVGAIGEEKLTDRQAKILLVTALDQEKISVEDVEDMVGNKPAKGRVRYDQWWITGCIDGMVSFILSSLRQEHPDLTREDVGKWPVAAVFETSRTVENLTAPNLGNG